MTDFEKQIYNLYLKTTRSALNKPSKTRSNFDNFEQDPKYINIKRLSVLFGKHKEIDICTYFEAPYKIYKDVKFFDLSYYASPRAIKAYSLYRKELEANDPDTFIDAVKKSLRFIALFCIEKNIQLIDYTSYTEGGLPIWIEHIKTNQITPYSIMELENVYSTINSLTTDEQSLLLGNFGLKYIQFKTNYNNSKLLKPFLQKTTHKLKNTIYKHLQIKK